MRNATGVTLPRTTTNWPAPTWMPSVWRPRTHFIMPRRWLSWAGKSGPHWFLFPHTMDMMRGLIDEEPIEVYAIGRKGVLVEKGVDTYDAVQALIRFEQAFVTFETSWIVPDTSPSVTDC